MVRTAIRPDDYVEFRDPSTKAVVFSTADSSRVYLSELDEGTAEVKSITVDVPAADGALDLTESVAGRPLYGNRTVTMAVSLVCADHPAAVTAVQSARRAIHGRMLEVETPDTRVSEGWYVGRVSIDSVEYPGEAAVLHITANCKPWVYYGTETVTLRGRLSATPVTWGQIESAQRGRIDDIVMSIEQPDGIWNGTTPWAYSGTITSDVALVMSSTPNLMEYGTMGEWHLWTIDSAAAGADWDSSWARESGTFGRVIGPIGNADMDAEWAYRWMFTSTAGTDGVERGLMVTGMRDIIRVRVICQPVQFTAQTTLDLRPAISVVAQGSRRPNGPVDTAGGLLANGLEPVYYRVWNWGDDTSMREHVVDIDPMELVPGTNYGSGGPMGYVLFGVEARWCTADIVSISVEVLSATYAAAGTGSDMPSSNVVTRFSAPAPLYSDSTLRNVVQVAPQGSSMTAPLYVPSGGSACEVADPPNVYQMQRPAIGGEPLYVRAYLQTTRGWMHLLTTLRWYAWATSSEDWGDMPTSFDVETEAPVVFEVDGERAVMATSGTAPFALQSGDELGYMILGDGDETVLTWERGTV